MSSRERTPSRTTTTLVVILALLIAASMAAGCERERAPEETPADRPSTEATSTNGDGTTTDTTPPADTTPEEATSSIRDVLASPVEGERVVLEGTIAEMLSDEDFLLDDGTGEVFVDDGDDDFGRLQAGNRVLVTGTVDVEDSPQRVEIDATAIERR